MKKRGQRYAALLCAREISHMYFAVCSPDGDALMLFALLLGLLSSISGVAGAATPYEQLLDRIAKARSIACTAIADGGKTLRIVATRDGKFRLESDDQHVVSNGVVVWNYRPSTKTVTIAPVSRHALNDLLHLANNIAGRYRATFPTNSTVLLRPADGAAMYGIEQLELRFRGSRLHTVAITRASSTERWRIHSLEFDRSPSESTFVFTIPAGVEVVDMR